MICTVMTVLWICYPRFRPLYALCMAAVAVGLVGANFHFLSDVIAGAFLGISAGWLGVSLWEIGDRRCGRRRQTMRPVASCKDASTCRMG
jgi:membrane-associated phospholipid phosphatase